MKFKMHHRYTTPPYFSLLKYGQLFLSPGAPASVGSVFDVSYGRQMSHIIIMMTQQQ